MARFEVRPVASQTKPDSWSHTLILSDPIHHLDVTAQPVWIIALSLTGATAPDEGPQLLEDINRAYQQIELKVPEALYQTLASRLGRSAGASVAAVCFTVTQATVMGRGRFNIQLFRNGHQTPLLSGENHKWSVVEGAWAEADRWWLTAGNHSADLAPALLEETDVEKAAETLNGLIAANPISIGSHVLITFNPHAVIETEDLDPAPVPTFLDDKPDPKIINKRRVMAVGWLVLILLVVSVLFGARARSEKITSENFAHLQRQVADSIATASALKTVDQVKARTALRELQQQVAESQPLFADNKKWASEWSTLNTTVNAAYQELAGEANLTALPEWFALSIVKAGLTGDRLVVSGTNAVVLDKTANTLVKIDTTSKRAEVVTGGETLKGSENLAVDGGRTIVITEAGIKEVSLSRKTVASLVEKDPEWQAPQAVALFNGNVYLLDTGAQEIWRYPSAAAGVGAKQRWLGTGVTLSSSTIVKLVVDGDIWVLDAGGTLKRYRRGALQSFTLTGLDTPLSAPASFTMTPDQDTLVVLDNGNQRLVRFDKTGNYQKQIKWGGLKDAQDIALSADGNTVYILKGGSIYTASF